MESNYDILGIKEGATQKDIRNAFRQMVLLEHADRGGDSSRFMRIKQAYEDLKKGKKYPDTPLEKLQSSRVFSGDTDREIKRRNEILGQEISAQMNAAQEWAGALLRSGVTGTRMFGSKTFGEMEFEVKPNKTLYIKGNYMAGTLIYGGPILMQGSINSPSWTKEFKTDIKLQHGDFKMVDPLNNRYRIENGASITTEEGNIVVGDVFGRKYRVNDPEGRVGLHTMQEHRTYMHAPHGSIVVENATDTVLLEGENVIIKNMEDDVRVVGRDISVYGSKATYDCSVMVRRGGSIRFFEKYSIIGLSDDMILSLENGKRLFLRDIKSKKIRDVVDDPDKYDKNETMVGNGFTITYDMLDGIIEGVGGKKSFWGAFGRR